MGTNDNGLNRPELGPTYVLLVTIVQDHVEEGKAGHYKSNDRASDWHVVQQYNTDNELQIDISKSIKAISSISNSEKHMSRNWLQLVVLPWSELSRTHKSPDISKPVSWESIWVLWTM